MALAAGDKWLNNGEAHPLIHRAWAALLVASSEPSLIARCESV
jgi:hypothetical protein